MKQRFIYICFLVFNCQCNMGQSPTEEKHLNYVVVEDRVYKKDSIELLFILQERLRKHESSFYSKEYYDSTEIAIDTILYNEQKNKIVLFTLIQNPTSRQLSPNKSYDFYYDAFCYIGKKNDTTDTWDIKWFRVFNLINHYNLEEIKTRIRERYFNELAEIVDGNDQPIYKYNLNDKRFWDGPVWGKYFD